MGDLTQTVANSKIWQSTLAVRSQDASSTQRERLRNVFLKFRERAGDLADKIRIDVPELTVHDLTHLDALWEISSTIVGDAYTFTPTEAFTFGGAVLLHDLAMSVAAIEGGYSEMKKDPKWKDLIISEYQTTYGRDPSGSEAQTPEPLIYKKVMFNYLRLLHAEKAEKLAFMPFHSTDDGPLFLIEDTEIRQSFGRLIGLIAHSHWYSIEEVEKNFSRVIGAPSWCPRDWIIDPLKVSCALRVADAAHLDASRAPSFLRSITDLSPSSEAHWNFQGKLNKPYLQEDALVFTSGAAFPLTESGSWWLCLEALRVLDRELRNVDAMFAEKGYPRFAARRVTGVDIPERLVPYVQTDGWRPINATIHVTDLPAVIKSIGGEELYGRNPQVSLRELIQNGCDAVRARRIYEKREAEYGRINISVNEPREKEFWLEVSDNGIGMSQRVLTDFLLDFGKTFWGSTQMQEELPGLISSGFKSTGKYGIGFFSVFMISDYVRVVTRRSDAAANETIILEFSSGLDGRPILRSANKNEQLIDGGTKVRLKLTKNPREKGGILYRERGERNLSLAELCRKMCPAVDVDVYVLENNLTEKTVGTNDWQTIEGKELLTRMQVADEKNASDKSLQELRERAGKNLRLLRNDKGEVFGRACITQGNAIYSNSRIDLEGVVTVGGLSACGLSGILGILLGHPTRASRDVAIPIVPKDILKRWAEEQADLVPKVWSSPMQQSACAVNIRLCGGNTKRLPIAKFKGKWISAEEIAGIENPPEMAIIIDHTTVDDLKILSSYVLDDNVFITEASGLPSLLQSRDYDLEWPSSWHKAFYFNTLTGAVVEALSIAWKVSLKDVLSANDLKRETKISIGKEGERDIQVRAIKVVKPSPTTPISI